MNRETESTGAEEAAQEATPEIHPLCSGMVLRVGSCWDSVSQLMARRSRGSLSEFPLWELHFCFLTAVILGHILESCHFQRLRDHLQVEEVLLLFHALISVMGGKHIT